jgi:hypothetical protein
MVTLWKVLYGGSEDIRQKQLAQDCVCPFLGFVVVELIFKCSYKHARHLLLGNSVQLQIMTIKHAKYDILTLFSSCIQCWATLPTIYEIQCWKQFRSSRKWHQYDNTKQVNCYFEEFLPWLMFVKEKKFWSRKQKIWSKLE